MKTIKYRLVFGFMAVHIDGVKVVQFYTMVELFPGKLIISLLRSTIELVLWAFCSRILLKKVSSFVVSRN